MQVLDFLNYRFLNNSVESYLWFTGILVFGFILKRLLSGMMSGLIFIIFKRYGKSVGIQKFKDLMTSPIEFLFSILLFYFAFKQLGFPPEWNLVPEDQFGLRAFLYRLFQAAVIISSTWIVLRLTDFIGLILMSRARKTKSLTDDQLVSFAKEAVKFIFVTIGFFVMLGVAFNLDIVSLLTGLGIGGIAIALAAKESLENLIGSFTIFLDKPFVTGDTVKVGSIEGRVENVGFRSTRIRANDRMIVTVPNKKMIDAELINDTDRNVRRSAFTLILTYDTGEEQLRKILIDIRHLLADHLMLEHGHEVVRFTNFGINGLEILINYFVLTPDREKFLAIQEELNFQIMQIVRDNKASFAVPLFYKTGSSENKPEEIKFKTLSPGK